MNKGAKVSKKGQVTIFIIIAVLIVSGVAAFFVFRDKIEIGKPSLEISPIINFVQECMDTTLEETIYNISRQGGYSGYSNIEITNENGVTYYLLNGKNYMPSKQRVELEISDYFERKFFLCTKHFANFSNYQIEEGNLASLTNIEGGTVKLRMDYPLTITKGDETSRIEGFNSEVQINLNPIYDSISYFIEQQNKTTNGLCLSCLETPIGNNINISMESFYDGTIVFTFTDDSLELNDKPFEWVFANKY
jgi:hypothetical protein